MKKILVLSLIMIMLAGCAQAPSAQGGDVVLATVYPLYVAALNLMEGVEGVAVDMLASPQSGCMHDYQLTTGDRVKAETCRVLIVNGLGLEPFLDKVIEGAGERVLTASDGFSPLIAEDADDHDEHDGHDHGDNNPHIWVSVSGMRHEVVVIAAGLVERFPEHADRISENLTRYLNDLDALYSNLQKELAPFAGQSIITVHNAFPYFAREYGLNIAAVVEREPGASPSAKELKEAADIARDNDVRAIFTEPLYEGRSAQTLAEETALPLYTLDPATTGAMGDAQGYKSAMNENLNTLIEALGGAR